MIEISPEDVRRLRLRRQLLHRPLVRPETVVQRLVGMQAQDLAAARLGVCLRARGSTDSGVERDRLERRTIVRTWAMRATLHLIAARDLGWLRPLLRPRIVEVTRRRSEELGLDERTYSATLGLIQELLAGEVPLNRSELTAELKSAGVDASGQRMPYLLLRASAEGLICEGPLRSGVPTYVLAADWLGSPVKEDLDRSAAVERLASRYLTAYGPASTEDFSWWSGLTISESRQAFHGVPELQAMQCDGRRLWTVDLDNPPVLEASVRRCILLPAFDTYLLGYRDRTLILDPSFARQVNAGGGMLRPTLVIDGRIEGIWTMKKQRGSASIEVRVFREPGTGVASEVEEWAAELGEFLGIEVRLEVRQRSK